MKTTYIKPNCQMILFAIGNKLMVNSTSTINISVSEEDFDGEGRVKGTNEWDDIWD